MAGSQYELPENSSFFKKEELIHSIHLSWNFVNSICYVCKILEIPFSKPMMLPVPKAAACCCRTGKTYVFTCFCSGDGLCQALRPALPCFPWNWQHSFVKQTVRAGNHARNQLLDMGGSLLRGVNSLGSCTDGLCDWLNSQVLPRVVWEHLRWPPCWR